MTYPEKLGQEELPSQEEIDAAVRALDEPSTRVDIPDVEKIHEETSLVTEQEMKEAVDALNEPPITDDEKIAKLKKELEGVPPPTNPPEEPGDGGRDGEGDENNSRRERKGIDIEGFTGTYRVCEACKGKGRLLYFFKCQICGGTGKQLVGIKPKMLSDVFRGGGE